MKCNRIKGYYGRKKKEREFGVPLKIIEVKVSKDCE